MYGTGKPVKYKSNKLRIILRNEPKLSEHDVDQKFNTLKKDFIPHIQEFVAEHDLFKGQAEVGIEFAHKGVSSIITIIDTPTNKWVLKIPRSKELSAGESQFFKVWDKAGVIVPHVLETGEINGLPYTLMDFVDALTVDIAYSQAEQLDKQMFLEMGQILRLMHSVSAEGYGSVIDDKPEFKTVEEWLVGTDMKMRFYYIKEHGLLDGLEEMLEKSTATIQTHAKTNNSTYCHADFGPANMFATSPITVFDSNPKFNSGYYDLGRIKFGQIAFANMSEPFAQLLSGYFKDEDCNEEVLTAYTFLAFCMKARYWHQTGKLEQLNNGKKYFVKNNH